MLREADIQHEVTPILNYGLPLALAGGEDRRDDRFSFDAAFGGDAREFADRSGLSVDGLDRLPDADDPQEGHHAGAGLPAPGERHLRCLALAFAIQEPLLVEMGVLLDLFTAVFVMGIAIHHISREFDHIDTDRLSALKD